MARDWKPEYASIISKYQLGESPTDIAKYYGCGRTTIKNIVALQYGLRNKSVAGKLSAKQGKKDKAIKALVLSAKTTNRNNPLKTPWVGNPHLNPRWKKNRADLKSKRGFTEEKVFFKELMESRGYVCDLTGKRGTLSVHHIKGVWKYPDLIFDKTNCAVILKKIHDKFHKTYGTRTDIENWTEFVNNKEFEEFIVPSKKVFIPWEDKVGNRYGRLVVLKWENGSWLCRCDCGNENRVSSSNLKKGKTRSCGCLQKEQLSKRLLKNPIWVLSSAAIKNTKTNRKCHLKKEVVKKQSVQTSLNFDIQDTNKNRLLQSP